jgi:hypothetical protein
MASHCLCDYDAVPIRLNKAPKGPAQWPFVSSWPVSPESKIFEAASTG